MDQLVIVASLQLIIVCSSPACKGDNEEGWLDGKTEIKDWRSNLQLRAASHGVARPGAEPCFVLNLVRLRLDATTTTTAIIEETSTHLAHIAYRHYSSFSTRRNQTHRLCNHNRNNGRDTGDTKPLRRIILSFARTIQYRCALYGRQPSISRLRLQRTARAYGSVYAAIRRFYRTRPQARTGRTQRLSHERR